PARRIHRLPGCLFRGGIDHDLCPGGVFHIAVLLALIGIGFEERDVVPASMEGAHDAPVVSGGAIPIRRNQAGTEERDAHQAASACTWPAMRSNSAARCAQVWRARMVSSPE